MDESKLVIACHCEKYPQMYLVNPDNTIGKDLSTEVTYVDPHACPGKTWERIAPESKKYVWGENCSVYMELRLSTKNRIARSYDSQLLNILRESYRILEKDGIVIFPLETGMYTEESVEIIRNDTEVKSKFTVSIIDVKDAPFRLGHSYDEKVTSIPKEKLIIFLKKSVTGGIRYKRKSRKLTRRKRLTRRGVLKHVPKAAKVIV
jgi:hypothetical protein